MKHQLLFTILCLCILLHVRGQELILNGDFESGNTDFTSDIAFNGDCAGSSYSIEVSPNDKCGSFLVGLTGITPGENFMVVDGPTSPQAIFISSTIDVTAGVPYEFSFAAASFSAGFTNHHPAFEVYVGDSLILSVASGEVVKDAWTTFTSATWTALVSESVQIEIVQSNATSGVGYDYCVDKVSFQPQCTSTENPDNLVENGSFSDDAIGFTSTLAFNEECAGASFFVETLPYNKCSAFSDSFMGQDACDKFMVIDGGSTPSAVWQNENAISVITGATYSFSFDAASFVPRSSYTNHNPSFIVTINGDTVLSVEDTEVMDDQWSTYEAEWMSNDTTAMIEIIQSNATGGTGYDYVLDNVTLIELCLPTENPDNLIYNGGFTYDYADFTSGLSLNEGCAGASYSVETLSYDKCGAFSNTFMGQNACDKFLVIDGGSTPGVVWATANGVDVSTGSAYLFSFDASSFDPLSNYSNHNPSFVVLINGDTVLVVDDSEVQDDEWITFEADAWVADDELAYIEIIQSNATGGTGYDYVIDNVTLIEGGCVSEMMPGAEELVENGGFQLGNTGFTSSLPYNGSCAGASYSIESTPYDKCGNFSLDLVGIDTCDQFLVIDGGSSVGAVWANANDINVTHGASYVFTFDAASFTPRSNYNNVNPSFEVKINGETILTVDANEVEDDVWNTYMSSAWVAPSTGLASIEIIHANASSGVGYDFVLDNVSFRQDVTTSTFAVEAPQLKLFPNPANGQVSVSASNLNNAQVRVYNQLGVLVQDEILTSESFQLEGDAGMYFVELSIDGEVSTFKMLKN